MRTVVCSVLFPRDHRLRMKKGPVWTSLHIINSTRLQIYIKRTRNVFSRAGLREEGRESSIITCRCLRAETSVRLRTRLQLMRPLRINSACSRSTHAQEYTIPLSDELIQFGTMTIMMCDTHNTRYQSARQPDQLE